MKDNFIGILIGILISALIFCILLFTDVVSLKKDNSVSQPVSDKGTTEKVTENNSFDETAFYNEYLKNKKSSLINNGGEYILSGSSILHDAEYNISIDSNLKLILNIDSLKKYNNYTVDENVIDAFLVSVGNGGYKYLYYLKDDGSVKSLCIDTLWDSEIKIKTENYKNVVSIDEVLIGNERKAAVTDINGKITILEG